MATWPTDTKESTLYNAVKGLRKAKDQKINGGPAMKKQKKSGVLYTLFLVLLLIGVSLTGTSEATVQLVPRVNAGGQILHGIANEDYVVFGKYRHASLDNTGTNRSQESNPTPVIWRVMSADAAPGSQKRAILLTHYLVDAMAYESTGTDNTWSGSDV